MSSSASRLSSDTTPLLVTHEMQANKTGEEVPTKDGYDIGKGGLVVGSVGGVEVREATAREHNYTFLEALKLYPKAVGWSVFFSMGIIMYADSAMSSPVTLSLRVP